MAPESKNVIIHRRCVSTGRLRKYDSVCVAAILKAIGDNKLSLTLNERCEDVRVDLKKMKQVHLDSGKEEDVVIEIPWDPTALAALAVASDTALRRKIIRMTVDTLRSPEHLDVLLSQKLQGAKVSKNTVANPYLAPGHLPYERFLSTLIQTVENREGGFGELLEATAAFPNDILQAVFHGSPPINVDPILRDGMNPGLRRGTGDRDWFGLKAAVSIPYAAQRHGDLPSQQYPAPQLLVFFVITSDAHQVHRTYSGAREGVLTVSSIAHQLPVGTIAVH